MSANIFIYPTDTVWGIGGNASHEEIYEKIAKIKNSDFSKPLSLLFSTIEEVQEYIEIDNSYLEVIKELKDLEVTFGVSKVNVKFPLPTNPFLKTEYICFRVLPLEFISTFIEKQDAPLITTSLNLSGTSPITSESDAHDFWKKYIPSGEFISNVHDKKMSGNSSTIILFSGCSYKVIREGRGIDKIREILKRHNLNE